MKRRKWWNVRWNDRKDYLERQQRVRLRERCLKEATIAANRTLEVLAREIGQLDTIPMLLDLGWYRDQWGSFSLKDPDSGIQEYPLANIEACKAAGSRIAIRSYQEEWERRIKEDRRRLKRSLGRVYAEVSGRHPRSCHNSKKGVYPTLEGDS